MLPRHTLHLLGALGAMSIGAACADEEPARQAPPPAEVSFVTVEPESVTLTEDLPGRVSAYRTAEVRARTSGIVLRRGFRGGEEVRAGELLFQIDPAPLSAVVDRAEAALERARAAAALASAEAERNRRLVRMGAISRAQWDAVLAEQRATAAQVGEAEAALREARVSLSYTEVEAPIDGVVGLPLVTEGALVGQGDATPLALVQQIDPVYVDIQQPAASLSAMRAAGFAEGQPVTIRPSTGGPALEGELLFSDVSVDPGTGEVTLRALVPNANAWLLPGQFVRAEVSNAVRDDALLVPQQAVTRDEAGRAQVLTLSAEGAAAPREVRPGAVVDGRYLIEEGLRAGERVIVEGQDKVRPGAPLHASPWSGERPDAVASAEP